MERSHVVASCRSKSNGIEGPPHPRFLRRFAFVGWMSVALLVITGCQQVPGGGDGGSTADLACQREAYPCSWAEVPNEVYANTLDLTEQGALRMHDLGETSGDVAAWLATLDGIAELDHTASAVRFRLEGGRPSWILAPKSSLAGGLARAAEPVSAHPHRDRATAIEPADVVGDPNTSKSAIILAPFAFEDSESIPSEDRFRDESLDVKQLLDATYFDGTTLVDVRGYGNVDLRRDALGDGVGVVTFEDFSDLAGHDLVHIATHGDVIECPLDPVLPCGPRREVLATSQPVPRDPTDEDFLVAAGVDFVTSPATAVAYLGVSDDFFANAYPDGLPDTLIFVNACRSLVLGTIAASLMAEGSVYLGWDETVSGLGANLTAIEFYESMLGTRRTSEVVHDEVAAGYVDPLAGARLLRREDAANNDLRLLESVTLVDDIGNALFDGADLSGRVIGTPGDGVDDHLEVRTRVDGVESGDAGSYTVRYSIDGAPVSGTFGLGGAASTGTYGYTATHEIPLGFDVKPDTPSLVLRAEIDPLPEGGTTVHAVSVDVRAVACSFDATVAGDFTGSFEGPAHLVVGDDGTVTIELSSRDYVTDGVAGVNAFTAIFGTAPGSATTALHEVTGASANHYASGAMVFQALYDASSPDFDCPACGGSLTLDTLDETTATGSVTTTMPVWNPDTGSGNDPYLITVDATFVAVAGSPFAGTSPWVQCLAQYGGE